MEIFKKEINQKQIKLGKQCQSLSQKILGKELDNQQLHFILNNHIDIISLIKNLIKDTKEKPKVRTNNNSAILNAIENFKVEVTDQISLLKTDVADFKSDVANQINSLKTDIAELKTDVALIKSLPTIQKEIQELSKIKNKPD